MCALSAKLVRMQTPTRYHNDPPRLETVRIARRHRQQPSWPPGWSIEHRTRTQPAFSAVGQELPGETMDARLSSTLAFPARLKLAARARPVAIAVWEQSGWEHPIRFAPPPTK